MNRYTPITGVYVAFGSYAKCQPGFRDEKRSKILGTSSGAKLAKQKILTFGPIIASVTLTAVSLQINGMLMMWKIQQGVMNCSAVAKRF